MKISCYAPRRIVRADHNDSIVNEICSTLVNNKCEVHITLEVKDYATLIVCKNSLTDFSNVNNPTLVVSKCSDIIPSKFKAIKFTL